MIQEAMEKQRENGPIILQQGEGKPPIQISNKQAVEIMKQQQEQMRKLTDDKTQNDKLNNLLKEKVSAQMKVIKALKDELSGYKSKETSLTNDNIKMEIIEKPPSFVQPVDGSETSEPPINKSTPVAMVDVKSV